MQKWAQRYNEGGLANLPDAPRSGQPRKCARELFESVKRRILAGPRPEDGVCALRGRDVQRILAAEFGVAQTLSATYALMHKLGLELLRPRPPYSPELNCVERIWLWMRSHDLSNRAYRDRAHVEEAVAKSCSRLSPERLRSICRTDWLQRAERTD